LNCVKWALISGFTNIHPSIHQIQPCGTPKINFDLNFLHTGLKPEGKFLIAEFEFGESLGNPLEGDCHELEVTPNLDF
jgi:hypothetical protein